MEKKMLKSVCRFALILMAFLAVGLPPLAQAMTLEIQAYVDGRDQLIIQGNTVQWEHFDYAAVGRWGGNNYPTYLKTTDINVYVAWTPDWPLPPPDEIRFQAVSSIFTGLSPALPIGPMTVTLTDLTSPARGPVNIVQYPEAGNGYTLRVDFNDNNIASPTFAGWYRVKLDIVAPLPGAVWLLGSGLLGLVAMRRARQS